MHANKEIYSLYIWTRREGVERERGDGERDAVPGSQIANGE